MRTATTIALLSFCAACGVDRVAGTDANANNPDAGGVTARGDATTQPTSTFPHGLCASAAAVPPDLGEFCPSGSNLSLCVLGGRDDCASGYCLWDAQNTLGNEAYCTMTCDPSETDPCPSGFRCRREECDDLAVCVQEGTPSEVAREPIPVLAPSVSNPGELDQITHAALAPDGRSFWGTHQGALHARTDGGVWTTLIAEPPGNNFGQFSIRGIGLLGGEVYVWGHSGWLFRIDGDRAISETPFVNSANGQPCNGRDDDGDGEADLGCLPYTVVGMLRTPNGAFEAIVERRDIEPSATVVYERDSMGVWTETTSTNMWIERAVPLRDQGYIGECYDADLFFCSGAEGYGPRAIGGGAGEPVDRLIAGGTTPDDAWFFAFDGLHHVGASGVTTEALPIVDDHKADLAFMRDGSIALIDDGQVLLFDGDCWSIVPTGASSYSPVATELADGRIGIATDEGELIIVAR